MLWVWRVWRKKERKTFETGQILRISYETKLFIFWYCFTMSPPPPPPYHFYIFYVALNFLKCEIGNGICTKFSNKSKQNCRRNSSHVNSHLFLIENERMGLERSSVFYPKILFHCSHKRIHVWAKGDIFYCIPSAWEIAKSDKKCFRFWIVLSVLWEIIKQMLRKSE